MSEIISQVTIQRLCVSIRRDVSVFYEVMQVRFEYNIFIMVQIRSVVFWQASNRLDTTIVWLL